MCPFDNREFVMRDINAVVNLDPLTEEEIHDLAKMSSDQLSRLPDVVQLSKSEIPSPPLPPILKGRRSRTWMELKNSGNPMYKTGAVEPIDLYKASGMFTDFALCSIIKYAYRYTKTRQRDRVSNLNKIIHYAQLLIAQEEERDDHKA